MPVLHGLVGAVAQPFAVRDGVKTDRVHQVFIAFDWVRGGPPNILVPVGAADQDNVVGVVGPDYFDDFLRMRLHLVPAFIVWLVERFVDDVGVLAIRLGYLLEEFFGFVEVDVVAVLAEA